MQLEELSLNRCSKLHDECFAICLATGMRAIPFRWMVCWNEPFSFLEGGFANLRLLDISGCSMLSAGIVVKLVKRAQNLSVLRAESNYRLEDAAIEEIAPYCAMRSYIELVRFVISAGVGTQSFPKSI